MEVFPNASVVAFEPDARAAERFRQRIGEDARVTFEHCAVSSKNGTAKFHVSSGKKSENHDDAWDESGSLRKPKEHVVRHPWCKFDKTVDVRTVSLDSWCIEQGIESIDFIWMDVQGAEGDVISGAKQILQSARFLYTEYSNREMYEGQLDLHSILRMLPDFRIRNLYSKDVLLENTRFCYE